MVKISSSILAADFANLKEQISQISNTDYIHCDIMDGHFVPNISFGFPVLEGISKLSIKPLDIHLMIEKLDKYIPGFSDFPNTDSVTFHYEGVSNHTDLIKQIKDKGIKAGIAIKPKTEPDVLVPLLDKIDKVLVMSVEPGFSLQEYIASSTEKIKRLKNLIGNRNVEIEVDGGANSNNIKEIVDAGASILVSGGTVFKSANPNLEIKKLKELS